jgi:peroxiredoxin Q/BCP
MLTIGAEAPDFTLTSDRGEHVSLSSFRGRQPVVLVFYPMDFTGGCTQQLCAIRDDHQRFVEAGALVLGVSAAPRLLHRAFSARHGYQFPLLDDRARRVAKAYETFDPRRPLVNLRTVYVVGKDGHIRFAERGMPSDDAILAALSADS